MQKGVVRKRTPSPVSEYGRQLKEKQNLKRQYNLRERQFSRYIKEAVSESLKGGNSQELFLQSLERRLDSIVFRMGMAQTRNQARQMVSHGHFMVNGRKLTVPSFKVKKGDVISVRPQSAEKTLFQNIKLGLKKYQQPSWLELDKEKMEAKVIGIPSFQEISPSVEVPLIFEFYSR